jgi:hypothetical protein
MKMMSSLMLQLTKPVMITSLTNVRRVKMRRQLAAVVVDAATVKVAGDVAMVEMMDVRAAAETVADAEAAIAADVIVMIRTEVADAKVAVVKIGVMIVATASRVKISTINRSLKHSARKTHPAVSRRTRLSVISMLQIHSQQPLSRNAKARLVSKRNANLKM